MCRVGQRCASSALGILKNHQADLEKAQADLKEARKSASDAAVKELSLKVANAQLNVDKAQHSYDSTKTGMKKLEEAGYSKDSPRYQRAHMQNVFGRSFLDRKKNSGQTLPSKEVLFA